MLSLLRNWILGLAGAAVFCAVMMEICPKGAVKNIVKMLCGMVMAVALISPFMKMDMPEYSMNMAKYRQMGEEIADAGKEMADSMSRTIIEEECRAYILDKGAALGTEIADASVKLRWSDEGFWYPVECEIAAERCEPLAVLIESELGIAKENQKWRDDEGT